MPLMFGFFSLSFASGLSIYFIASNLIGIAQYAMMGRVNVKQALGMKPEEARETETVTEEEEEPAAPAVAPAAPRKARRAPARQEAPRRTRGSEPKPVPRRTTGSSGIYDSRANRARAKNKAKG